MHTVKLERECSAMQLQTRIVKVTLSNENKANWQHSRQLYLSYIRPTYCLLHYMVSIFPRNRATLP